MLSWLRLLLLGLGLSSFFIIERYFWTDSSHYTWRFVTLFLYLSGITIGFFKGFAAKKQEYTEEARSWVLASLVHCFLFVGLLLYSWHAKVLADEGALPKLLLAAWLVLVVVPLIALIGTEWSLFKNGVGPLAESSRVSRARDSWLAVGLLFASLVAINYTANQKNFQRDLSYFRSKTPSASTKNALKTLKSELSIALFYPHSNEVKDALHDYFAALEQSEDKVKLSWVDKDMSPVKAEEYKVSQNGVIVLTYNGKSSRLDTGLTLSKAKKTLKDLDMEFQKIFLEATASRKTIYFTRGHGEMSWVGDDKENPLRSIRLLESFLRQQNYVTKFLGVAEGSGVAVPEDAGAVIIAGPERDFSPEEVAALKLYVQNGGSLMIFLDITQAKRSPIPGETLTSVRGLGGLLAEAGIEFNDTPIANEKNHLAASRSLADRWFLFSNIFTSHESVASLAKHDERVAVLLYHSGSLKVGQGAGGWVSSETVRTLPDTFLDANRNFSFDANETKGAQVVGAAANLKDKASGGKITFLADATVLSDGLIRNIGNALFFSDSLKWLTGQVELMGELSNEEDVKIRHTSKEDVIWFHGTVVVVPLLILAAGFLANRKRRPTIGG